MKADTLSCPQRTGKVKCEDKALTSPRDEAISMSFLFQLPRHSSDLITMRALICTVTVMFSLYGTSLFSRDRDNPPWAHTGQRQSEPAQPFESVASLLESLDDVTTSPVVAPQAPPVTVRHDTHMVLSAVPSSEPRPPAAAPASDKRSVSVRKSADGPAKAQAAPRRKVAQIATKDVTDYSPATRDGPIAAQPVEYGLADRGN
jgi:hypothetical protein